MPPKVRRVLAFTEEPDDASRTKLWLFSSIKMPPPNADRKRGQNDSNEKVCRCLVV